MTMTAALGSQGGFRPNLRRLPSRIDRGYAIEKARRILGYHPRFGVTELLHQEAA